MADFYSSITTTDIENQLDLQTKAAQKVEKFLKQADENYVKGILGDNYSTIQSKGSGDPAYDDVEAAVIYFAISIALPHMNVRITNNGGLVTATGFEQSRQELMSTNQVYRYTEYYENMAWQKLKQHIPSSSDDTRLEISSLSFMSPDTPYPPK